MFLDIIFILIISYVIISLWTINSKLNLISDHLNINEENLLSDEEIEKELEEEWNK